MTMTTNKVDSTVIVWHADATASTTVESMIETLAGVCDGANSLDNQGFSGMDTHIGHSLANRTKGGGQLSEKQASLALKYVSKYQRQLGGREFIQEFLKAPVFRQLPRGYVSPNAPVVEEKKPVVRTITSNDKTAIIKFDYNAEIVAAIKTIRGEHRGKKFWAAWDAANKSWTLPVNETSIVLLMEMANKFKFTVEERFTNYLARIEEKTQESRVMLFMNDNQHITVDDDSITIAVEDVAILEEFERELFGVVKAAA
jgi:hypothetical protein